MLMTIAMLAISAAADQTITVRGEIADTFCLGAKGIRGAAHVACALSCAKKGIPLAIVDDATHRVYMLLPAQDNASLPPAVINAAGTVHSVTGRVFISGGTRFLTVDSFH
jgi:hypothetical protein